MGFLTYPTAQTHQAGGHSPLPAHMEIVSTKISGSPTILKNTYIYTSIYHQKRKVFYTNFSSILSEFTDAK